MELEVEMYVRHENGIITKIKAITEVLSISNIPYKEYIFENGMICSYGIKKSSHNLIDLIEVGDLIEVEEFKGIYEVRRYGLELSIVKENEIYNLHSYHCSLKIKSIVTKEQFNSIKYEVK